MRSKHRNRASGFTLIELLVVVIIIGILAAIALPNFVGAQNKAKEASVKSNMRTCQIAAETHATDAGGQYPDNTTGSFRNYFPGGDNQQSGSKIGTMPVNPFSNKSDWGDLLAGSVTDVPAARATDPTSVTIGSVSGQIEYSPIADSSGQFNAYAIRGGNYEKKCLAGTAAKTSLVLSNQ
jgi:prepilin-type N-terminal cleavage/methylation domain-containing protein